MLYSLPLYSLPRMRGDRPGENAKAARPHKFTPHARGSTHLPRLQLVTLIVYPHARGSTYPLAGLQACAYPACGIDPCASAKSRIRSSLPACADQSFFICCVRLSTVYPACGDRPQMVRHAADLSYLHVRGSTPFPYDAVGVASFTPHARGSTELLARALEEAEVYPACAGIDLEFHTIL